MEQEMDGLKNFNIAVKKRQGDMIFLRKIVPGPAMASYGVEVAKLAGLNESVVARARKLLTQLEEEGGVRCAAAPAEPDDQMSMLDMTGLRLKERLETVSPDTLTPIEALSLIYELKKLL